MKKKSTRKSLNAEKIELIKMIDKILNNPNIDDYSKESLVRIKNRLSMRLPPLFGDKGNLQSD